MGENDLVQIENLCVSYDKGKCPVISGVNLYLEKGCLTAVLGLNGSGKTTLLKAICGLLPSFADKKVIAGKNMAQMSCREQAACLSYIPQKQGLTYHINVLDVVLMGANPELSLFGLPTKAHRERAEELLLYVGIPGVQGRDFQSLSEGQKQLVVLARALMQNAPVMMFDEPDSALDFENKRLILQKIGQIVKEKQYAGLLTIHDPDYALRYCDKILLLQNGRIQDTITCKNVNREEAEQKLRKLYPALKLAVFESSLLTVK